MFNATETLGRFRRGIDTPSAIRQRLVEVVSYIPSSRSGT